MTIETTTTRTTYQTYDDTYDIDELADLATEYIDRPYDLAAYHPFTGELTDRSILHIHHVIAIDCRYARENDRHQRADLDIALARIEDATERAFYAQTSYHTATRSVRNDLARVRRIAGELAHAPERKDLPFE